MAKQVLTDAYVSVDSNDISDHVRSVTIEYSADAIEDTTMSDDTHTFLGGLKNYTLSVQLANDFSASELDSILFPLVGTAITVAIRPDSAAVGTSNPEYGASMLLTSYPPLGNAVGELAEASIEFVPGGSSPTLTRSTS